MANKRKRKGQDAARHQQTSRKKVNMGPHAGSKNAKSNAAPFSTQSKGGKVTQSTPSKQAIFPFEKTDHVLLVGEGDFSFARSLHKHHGHRIASLIATTVDSREDLMKKHPQAEKAIAEITSTHNLPDLSQHQADTNSEENESDNELEGEELDNMDDESTSPPPPATVLYNIDATRLQSYPSLRKRNPAITKIAFNFPHVGGRSTDVNRQVRYNQALVREYFKASAALLSSAKSPSGDAGRENNGKREAAMRAIFVTLFEGEPYTLWNVRDLARSEGLIVKRSWAFDATLYPGYKHARTLGNLKNKDGSTIGGSGSHDEDGDNDVESREGDNERYGKKKERWRGEERSARTYEFGLPETTPDITTFSNGKSKKKKRKSRDEDSSASES